MADRKPTPIAKVYEALSAVADQRVTFPTEEPGEALVVSSDHSKQYTVRFGDGFYSSNDNALQKLVRIVADQLGALDFAVKGNRAQMRQPEA